VGYAISIGTLIDQILKKAFDIHQEAGNTLFCPSREKYFIQSLERRNTSDTL
jgi:hypothetical protein